MKKRRLFGLACILGVELVALLTLARDAEVEARSAGCFDEAVRINHWVCQLERAYA